MDPSVIASPQFGIIWRKKLLGRYNGWNGKTKFPGFSCRLGILTRWETEQIFAQALVYTPDDTQFVYVVSQQNWVYKIDAKTGDILIAKNIHIPFLVSELDNCNDISQTIGSTVSLMEFEGVRYCFPLVSNSLLGFRRLVLLILIQILGISQ